MAEDQGVNGDRWTEEASRFLKKLGWEKIADSNVDIPGADNLVHGIDAMFKYTDGFRPTTDQGVFLEAKSYATDSFSAAKLRDWVVKFDDKIRELRVSPHFYERYPEMEKTNPRNGLLMLWFHDLRNYHEFYPDFCKALLTVRTPKTRGSSALTNRLFVLENDGILRLSSMIEATQGWNAAKGSSNDDFDIRFYYPSSARFGHAIQETTTLNLEYIYSRFILAKAKEHVDDKEVVADIVFYFGSLDIQSFRRLHQALLSFDMLSSKNSLVVFTYQRDDAEFRKIRPDVERVFATDKGPQVSLRTMNILGDLPSWIKDEE